MKIVTLMGSPRKKGNTDIVLSLFEAKMKENGHRVERINIAGKKIAGCSGCWACAKAKSAPGCAFKDGAIPVFKSMMSADATVYATPLYCWDFTSQMRALIDRHVCLVSGFETPAHASALEGKTTALLVTCEGPVKDNADLIQIMFDRLNGYGKSCVAGKFIVPGCVSPESIGPKAEKTAVKMVAAMEKTALKRSKSK